MYNQEVQQSIETYLEMLKPADKHHGAATADMFKDLDQQMATMSEQTESLRHVECCEKSNMESLPLKSTMSGMTMSLAELYNSGDYRRESVNLKGSQNHPV